MFVPGTVMREIALRQRPQALVLHHVDRRGPRGAPGAARAGARARPAPETARRSRRSGSPGARRASPPRSPAGTAACPGRSSRGCPAGAPRGRRCLGAPASSRNDARWSTRRSPTTRSRSRGTRADASRVREHLRRQEDALKLARALPHQLGLDVRERGEPEAPPQRRRVPEVAAEVQHAAGPGHREAPEARHERQARARPEDPRERSAPARVRDLLPARELARREDQRDGERCVAGRGPRRGGLGHRHGPVRDLARPARHQHQFGGGGGTVAAGTGGKRFRRGGGTTGRHHA